MKRKQKPTSYRDLCRLVKRQRIAESTDSKAWPPAHRNTFEQIRNIRDQKFDNYYTDNQSERPWKVLTKRRAECLAYRATTLLDREANEDEWRDALEGELMLRFRAEVQWYVCLSYVLRQSSNENPVPHVEQRFGKQILKPTSTHLRTSTTYEKGGKGGYSAVVRGITGITCRKSLILSKLGESG
jgi:hypothetical protein